MTTLQPQSSSYPQNMLLGEQMELSPHPGIDDDIDIDLDLDPGPSNDQDNDYIIEDAESGNTAEHLGPSIEVGNDDVMRDEDHTYSDVQEQDVEFPDEELYDAQDQILTDDLSNKQQRGGEYAPNVTTLEPSDTPYSPRLNISGGQSATGGEQEINFTQHETYTSENTTSLTAENHEHENSPQETEVTSMVQQKPPLSEPNSPNPNPLNQDDEQVVPFDERSASSVPATSLNGNGEDDDALTDTYEEDGPDEPKDPLPGVAHIHPVVVIYEGNEISLFPPSKNDPSDTFFLPDESLARANICDLFEAIRSVLAGSISDDDELDMIVDGLGLELSEDSIHARTTTLSQIVDLHVQLSHQDGVEEPDPLYMALTTKVRFSKRFNDIVTAAAEGQGISQLPFWHNEEQDGVFPTENTSHSEDTDRHSGWEADYSLHQESDNPDMTGSGRTGTSPDVASPPAATNQEDIQGQSGAVSPAIPVTGHVVESAAATGDETNEFEEPTAEAENEGFLKEDYPPDEPVVMSTTQEEVAQETPSNPAEDELRDDDLIDYDDDDGAGQYHSTGSSTLQSDGRRTSNGIPGTFIQPGCSLPKACFCADCIILLEAEYAAINDAASRRSSTGKSGIGASKDPPKDEVYSEVEQVAEFGQTGVSGYDEDYGQYDDENDYGESQQYGDEARNAHSEVFEDPEQYLESTSPNEYPGFEEQTGNEYAINPEDWTSNTWHSVEQDITGENEESVHGDGIETREAEYDGNMPEHANLDFHHDENPEEHSAHGSSMNKTNYPDGIHLTLDVPAPSDISGGQHLQEAERPLRDEEDSALYDEDEDGDMFGDSLYTGDEPLGASDGASQDGRLSSKRSLDDIEYGNEFEGDRQADTKRMRSR